MRRHLGTGTDLDRLLAHLLADPDDTGLADELRAWLRESGRFRAFADANRDKIRKKLRTAADPESRRDVRAELLTAHLLLVDRRLDLGYEGAGAAGGPDFTLAYAGERPYNLEVTRPRSAPAQGRLGAQILAKLRQLTPGMPNALLVVADRAGPDDLDVAAAVRELRARADAKDQAYFVDRGFDGTRAFYDRFLRLGAVIAWAEGGDVTPWRNPSARIPLPQRGLERCVTALRAAPPAGPRS